MSNYTKKDCEGNDTEIIVTGALYLPGNAEGRKAFIRKKKSEGSEAKKKTPKTANKSRVV